MAKKPPADKAKAKKPAKEKKPKASAKGRSIKNDAGATETAPVKSDAKQIEAKDFQNLHRRRTSLKKQAKEINGSAGELMTSAAENKNLDKPAFAFIEKLWAMSPQKRLTTLACFDYYRTIPHFATEKRLDQDETGQGSLDIPRTEAGAGKGSEPAKDTTGASAQKPNGENVVDLRPPHLRPVSEGGTKADTDDDAGKSAAVH